MLWRVRTTLPDRPGALAALAARCGGHAANILGLQIFPDAEGVTDELVLRTPHGWEPGDVGRMVRESGGRQIAVARCTAHALTDAPTRYLRAALRLVHEPHALQAVLDELLDADEWAGELGARHDRLAVSGAVQAQVRRPVRFTDTERARVRVLGELSDRLLGSPAEGPAAQAGVGGRPFAADARPLVRTGTLDDGAALVRMHERCSYETLLRRYHTPVPGLAARAARRLLAPPGGTALVAAVGSEVVGCAVVALADDRGDDGVMEVGLLVEDAWQRRGVGSALLHCAARYAAGRRAADLLCVMEADNPAVLPTVQRSGLTCHVRALSDVVEVRIPLSDVPAPGPGPSAAQVGEPSPATGVVVAGGRGRSRDRG